MNYIFQPGSHPGLSKNDQSLIAYFGQIHPKIVDNIYGFEIFLENLVKYKEADIINLPPVDGVDFFVNDKLLFKAEIGETNGQVAVSLKNRL